MACSRCGAVAALDDASCSVCNPWAAPKQQAAAERTAGVPKRTAPENIDRDLPSWLRVLIRINPPAAADLDKAWRTTVRFTQVSVALFVLIAVCCIFMGTGTGARAAYPIFFLLLMVYVLTAQRMRKASWLAQAVAVVGTRPDIGYRRFARIPAVVRVTTMNKVVSATVFVLFITRVITLHQSVPVAVNVGLWVLIWVVAAASALISYALHGRAREELDRMLNAPRG